jgi:hypothetical protein
MPQGQVSMKVASGRHVTPLRPTPQTLSDIWGDPFAEPDFEGSPSLADKRAKAVMETPGERVVGHHHTPDARKLHLLVPLNSLVRQNVVARGGIDLLRPLQWLWLARSRDG